MGVSVTTGVSTIGSSVTTGVSTTGASTIGVSTIGVSVMGVSVGGVGGVKFSIPNSFIKLCACGSNSSVILFVVCFYLKYAPLSLSLAPLVTSLPTATPP